MHEFAMRTLPRWIALVTILALGGARPRTAAADDAFYDVALSELKITSGQLPKAHDSAQPHRFDRLRSAMLPRVVLNGGGEAYLKLPNDELWRFQPRSVDLPDWPTRHLVVRATAAGDVTGQLILPSSDASDVQRVGFTIPSSTAKQSARQPFYEAKIAEYQWLAQAPIA